MCRCVARYAVAVMLFSGMGAGASRAAAPDGAPQVFRVMMDQARIMKLDEPAQTLVIGNPAIADAVVSDGRTLIITGKAFGTTNLIALDRAGKVIAEKQLEVQKQEINILTIQRGQETESYSCVPKCNPTPVQGDRKEFFDGTIQQSQQRSGWASGGGGK